MKKTIFIFAFLIICSSLYAQKFDVTNINNPSQDSITYVRDIHFINENTGYIAATKFRYHKGQYINNIYYVYKTVNGGQNWTKKWGNVYPISSKEPSLYMIDANTVYLNIGSQTFKTVNGGDNWTSIAQGNLTVDNIDRMIVNTATDVGYLIDKYGSTVYKMTSTTQGFLTNQSFSGISLQYISASKVSSNTIYVSGMKSFYPDPRRYPFLAKTTNAGQNWQTILDGNSDPNEVQWLYSISVTNDNGVDVVKIAGNRGLIEYKNVNNTDIITKKCSWDSDRLISFGDVNNGYAIKYDGGGTEDPEMYPDYTNIQEIYKTTDGGVTWVTDNSGNTAGESFRSMKKFYANGEITYYSKSGGGVTAQFIARKLFTNFRTYAENISMSGSYSINGSTHSTPDDSYIRGGIYPVWTEAILNSGQNNEEIFYRWTNNSMNRGSENFRHLYEEEIGAYYKTKLKADNAWAINNPVQTKAIRDTSSVSSGMIHQVCETIGGIFYARSTDGGSSFQRDEVVNYDAYSNDATGNTSPSVTVKRCSGGLYPLTMLDANKNVAVVWERYNSNTGNTEIQVADRVSNIQQNGYEWQRYYVSSGVPFWSFYTGSSTFYSYPKIFVSSPLNSNLYNSAIVVPHLEPNSSGGKKLVITIRYQNQILHSVVDDGTTGTINNFAVSAPFNYYGLFRLHIVYQKDNTVNNIVYKEYDAGLVTMPYTGPYINEISNTAVANIGAGDGQRARFCPDISVENGLPVITYSGNYYDNRIISTGSGETDYTTVSNLVHSVIVSFKKSNGTWSSYNVYRANTPLENPNVEGSKTAMAYLLSYKKNGAYNQFVKIDGLSGYSCEPGVYNGTDAKIIRGGYVGQLSSNYNPMLLTLSAPSNSVYTIGKQSFNITSTPSGTDGYSNLAGTIIRDDISYTLDLGPIIASNTCSPFGDDTPPQTVQNNVEFNETMKSAPFSLSNNDTLILGTTGTYSVIQNGNPFEPLIYHVSLLYKNNNTEKCVLFTDTIQSLDTVPTSFLRGFVIDNISNGTDSFYVQLFIDTVCVDDGDYFMGGIYYDNSSAGLGDGPHSNNTKVFFSKSKTDSKHTLVPDKYELSQNYPNPFNPSTTIKYALPKDGLVSIKIYDITGREIKNLVNEVKQAGYHTVLFNASNLSSGMYFYRIQSGDFIQTKKMVLIK
jgi:hypothetical protein